MTARRGSRSLRGAGRVLAALGLVAAVLAVVGPTAGSAGAAAASASAPAGAYAETRTLRRAHLRADGSEQVVEERTVTVTADHTTELRGRERIHIAWRGARPSGGRSANPYGEGGLTQEYPVVILQCRGVDDPDAPAARQIRPETCWTTTSLQRSAVVTHRTAVWRHDRYAEDAARDVRSGVEPFPADQCETPSTAVFSARVTPFIAAGGQTYLGCDPEHMPPEAAIGATFPPAEVAAFTNGAGEGEINFEVRSEAENASLGCSQTVACSVVVIPIMGISCGDADTECRRNGNFTPGSSNFEGVEPHWTVSSKYWWSPSNWRNRFTIPLTFALPPDACNVLDPRPPTGFYGSELLDQAALQWSPAYCLNKSRFKFQHNRMPDAAGFNLMTSGGAPAAFVSGEHELRGDDPVGYAPTAVTGFGVGYVIDRPDNAGEFANLRLNARLLAKLLTQSYPASALGRGHPGLEKNPLSINLDPEFKALNPGLDERDREAAATVLSLSDSSDVIETLTAYIHEDPAARAFVAGKPDPWGMRVNPSYRDISLPRPEWPLLDSYKPDVQEGTCRHANNDTPYLTQVAAPVTSLSTIAEALIDAWPNVQTTCEGPLAGGAYRTGRVSRQPYGQRFMLGIISLGDAERYGLRTAALETSADRYVAPSRAALARGVQLAEQDTRYGPFELDQQDVREDGRAYPGTMIVYTAARLRGMAKAEAAKVASFIRIATTEGQRTGRGNGQLPEGFLPITKTGTTKKLYDSARIVAAAVAAQRRAPSDAPSESPTDAPGTDPRSSAPDAAVVPAAPPGGAAPSAGPSAAPTAAPAPTTGPVQSTATEVERSALAGLLLPLLLGLGVLGGVVSAAVRVATGVRGSRA